MFVLLLAGGTALLPFLFNFPTTCFIYFLLLQTDYSTAAITKKGNQMEKAITPRIPGSGAQGYSSSYLDAVSDLQWSDFFFYCPVFITLKGQRRPASL